MQARFCLLSTVTALTRARTVHLRVDIALFPSLHHRSFSPLIACHPHLRQRLVRSRPEFHTSVDDRNTRYHFAFLSFSLIFFVLPRPTPLPTPPVIPPTLPHPSDPPPPVAKIHAFFPPRTFDMNITSHFPQTAPAPPHTFSASLFCCSALFFYSFSDPPMRKETT